MMKKILLAFSLLLILAGAGCATNNKFNANKIEWKTETFKNSDYNFEYSLSYPKDWKIDKADDSSNVVASVEGVNEAASSFTVMILATGSVAKNATEVAIQTKHTFEREFPASIIGESSLTANNHLWQNMLVKKLLVSARGAGQTTYKHAEPVSGEMTMFFTDSAPYVYRVMWSLSDKDHAHLLPIYEEMLKRLVIVK